MTASYGNLAPDTKLRVANKTMVIVPSTSSDRQRAAPGGRTMRIRVGDHLSTFGARFLLARHADGGSGCFGAVSSELPSSPRKRFGLLPAFRS
jgi:hypothetical protein